MARFTSVVAFTSLCALSAASYSSSSCSSDSGTCNDVIDTTSLLSVAVELHNVAKANSAAHANAEAVAKDAVAAADAAELSQSPTLSAADSRAQNFITSLEGQVKLIKTEAENIMKWGLNESDIMQQELINAKPYQQDWSQVMEQRQGPSISSWITKSVNFHKLFTQMKDMTVTVLNEANCGTRAQAVATSDNTTNAAASTLDYYLMTLGNTYKGLSTLTADEIYAKVTQASYIEGTSLTIALIYAWHLNECVAHMFEAAESGLKASGANTTKLSPRFANALESVKNSSLTAMSSLHSTIANDGNSGIIALGPKDPLVATKGVTINPLQMNNPNLATDMRGTTKKLMYGSIAFLGVAVIGFYVYRYWM